jgi:hypothetical protein
LDGQRRWFSTGETSLKAAQSKAAAIMAGMRSPGFDAAIKLHSKRRDGIPEDPTIDEFAKLHRLVMTTLNTSQFSNVTVTP